MSDSPTNEMIEEERQHLEVAVSAEAENPTPEGRRWAAGHADTQVRRAVTIGQYEEILDVALRNVDLDVLLPQILRRIKEMFGADQATVYLIDESGQSLYARASIGFERAVHERMAIPVGEGLAGAVVKSRTSQTLNDVSASTVSNGLLIEMGIHSLIAVPILLAGQPIGVMTVGCRTDRPYDPQEVHLLELVAARLALAIERTQILALVQKERGRAERASRFKTTLLHMASHDIKTPLTAMKLQLHLLPMLHPALAASKGYGIVDRNVNRMELILDDFLDLARVEAGKFELQRKNLDLHALAQEVVDMYLPQAAQKKLHLILQGSPLLLEADGRRLTQVLVNLVSNAIRYTAAGSVILHVKARDADFAQISVTDTGQGMSQGQIARLFQPFGQVHEGIQEGTGLGLYLTKIMVDAHGGDIRIESKGPGQGTTVLVDLPMRVANPIPAAA